MIKMEAWPWNRPSLQTKICGTRFIHHDDIAAAAAAAVDYRFGQI